MNILVIFTGGTIGSASGKKWISLDDSTNYTLIENYKKEGDGEVCFSVLSPYSILSENLSGEELTTLCDVVKENAKKDFDGIIVTHGTDTIQYTAAALSFVVNAKDIPIVLVSANYPLEDERTNGNANFKAAVDFIKSKKANGVFVSYQNALDKDVEIHLGSLVVGHAEAMDNLFSLGGNCFALVNKAGEVTVREEKPLRFSNGLDVKFAPSPKTLMVNSFPGDDFNYSLDGVKAVLIKPYHSGTLNTESKEFLSFCEMAKDKGVPVFLCNVTGGKAYSSSKIYKDLSLTVLPFSAIPAIYVKIWLAVSLNKPIAEFVINEISQEFSV